MVQDDVDTSVWAPDVQAFTRMFYARYGQGPPGQTPWRLGRGLQPRFSDAATGAAAGAGDDSDTFLTKAHTDIQARPSPLEWQRLELQQLELQRKVVITKQQDTSSEPSSSRHAPLLHVHLSEILTPAEMDLRVPLSGCQAAQQTHVSCQKHHLQTHTVSTPLLYAPPVPYASPLPPLLCVSQARPLNRRRLPSWGEI